MPTPTVARVVESHLLSYRRTWRGSIVTSFLNPLLFLAAMGLGLGSLVDDSGRSAGLEGGSYLAFLAPGLLAAAAMQTAAAEAAYPVMAGIKWTQGYHAMLATPIDAADVAVGQLLWIAVRVLITAVTFTAVVVAFGAAESWGVLAAVPVAVLTGMAFAAPVVAFTASLDNEYGLSGLFRFGIIPMFLFSGTFFPIEQLPGWLQPVAWVTPLWHGVELCRSLSLGTATAVDSLGHAAYLSAWIALGTALAVWRMRKRLVT